MPSELVRAWAEGWTVSRGKPWPVPDQWGLRIDVGHPRQLVRHVLLDPEPDEASVRKLVESVTTPATWVKAPVAPETLAPWFPEAEGWTEDSPGWLMTKALPAVPEAVSVPEGYTLVAQTRGRVTFLRVLAADGTEAAHGQVAVPEGSAVAVVDIVETDPAHQRRGLGSVVMKSLAKAALDLGAAESVLGATVQGRALYETLGWSVRAPLAGFLYRRPDPELDPVSA